MWALIYVVNKKFNQPKKHFRKLIKMDILISNFSEKLRFIIDSVMTADFIAVDTEFSGLSIGYED